MFPWMAPEVPTGSSPSSAWLVGIILQSHRTLERVLQRATDSSDECMLSRFSQAHGKLCGLVPRRRCRSTVCVIVILHVHDIFESAAALGCERCRSLHTADTSLKLYLRPSLRYQTRSCHGRVTQILLRFGFVEAFDLIQQHDSETYT